MTHNGLVQFGSVLVILIIVVELFDLSFILPNVIKTEESSGFSILSHQLFFVFGNRAYLCGFCFSQHIILADERRRRLIFHVLISMM